MASVGTRAPERLDGWGWGRGRAVMGGSKLTVQNYPYVPERTRGARNGARGAPRAYPRTVEPRTGRIVRSALLAVGVSLVGLALAGATLAVQFGGGWDAFLDRSQPGPEDPEVVQARAAAAGRLEGEVARLVQDVIAPALDGGRVLVVLGGAAGEPSTDPPADDAATGADGTTPTTRGSGCEVGTHTWKRDDPFDLRCVEVQHGAAAGRRASIDADLVAVDRALAGEGWVAGGWPDGSAQGLLATREYWVEFGGTQRAGRPYAIEDLPSAPYRSADGNVGLALSFGADGFVGRAVVPAQPGDGEYVLVVTAEVESFAE